MPRVYSIGISILIVLIICAFVYIQCMIAENDGGQALDRPGYTVDNYVLPAYEPADDMIDMMKSRITAHNDGRTVITVSFAGDCTLGTDERFPYINSFPWQLERVGNDFGYFFGDVANIFKSDHLTLVNLETTLTRATKRADKTFAFRGDPCYANILKEGFVETVSISNNHIYDYLQQGFEDTLAALDDAGIEYCGEGFLACSSIMGVAITCIGDKVWSDNSGNDLLAGIREAKSRSDVVIVSLHWGREREHYPDAYQQRLARLCIDNGADIVVGHHPHVIQGIERYKDRYIVYSLGNFCFGGNRNPSDKDTFIFQCAFTVIGNEVAGTAARIIPCSVSSVDHVNDYRPTVKTGSEGQRILERIYKYSSRLEYGINDPSHPLSADTGNF
jgi:hypothetical protein